MPSRGQKIRFGIFILIIIFTVVVLLVIFARQKFIEKRDIYYISYKDISVSGLEVGSPVKYLGVKVGTIEDIRIDPKDVSRIIIKVGLKPGTPVKVDARADIASIGITGLKMIEIRGGSNEAPLLKPGSFIPPGSSITEEITGKAEIIAEKLELILNNLQILTQRDNIDKILKMVDQTTTTFQKIETVVEENRLLLHSTLQATENTTARLDSITQTLHKTAIEVNKIVSSDTLKQILASTRDISIKLKKANILQLIDELSEMLERTNRLLVIMDSQLQRGSRDFLMSMRQLKTTLQNLDETSRLIQEDPSVLIRGTKYKGIPDKKLDQ